MDELRSKLIDRLAFLVILYTAVWKVIKRGDGIKKLINRKKNKKKITSVLEDHIYSRK